MVGSRFGTVSIHPQNICMIILNLYLDVPFIIIKVNNTDSLASSSIWKHTSACFITKYKKIAIYTELQQTNVLATYGKIKTQQCLTQNRTTFLKISLSTYLPYE